MILTIDVRSMLYQYCKAPQSSSFIAAHEIDNYDNSQQEGHHYNHNDNNNINNNNNIKTNNHHHQQHIYMDPVYLEDDQVFNKLVLKETTELLRRRAMQSERKLNEQQCTLTDPFRHSLMSWLLKVCEHEQCQDEIFPLAAMILDKFLLSMPSIFATVEMTTTTTDDNLQQVDDDLDLDLDLDSDDLESNEDDQMDEGVNMSHGDYSNSCSVSSSSSNSDTSSISTFTCSEQADGFHRRIYTFAACALLLATKLRQTPSLSVQALIEFSRDELSIPLTREEIIHGEILVLSALRWDLAALATPNDFLTLLWGKCRKLIGSSLGGGGVGGTSVGSVSVSMTTSATNVSCASEQEQNCQRFTPRRHRQDHVENKEIDSNNNDISTANGCQTSLATITTTPETPTTTRTTTTLIQTPASTRCDESRVRRHTQTLLELCLMGK